MPWTRFIDRLLESQRWLDATGVWIQKLVTAIFKSLGGTGRVLKLVLNGTWLGHQLHPLITDVPIGAFTVGVVFDLVSIVRPSHGLQLAADWSIAIGWIASLGAFLTGWTEFMDTDARERRYGVTHGLLNTLVIVVYLVSLVIRFSQGSRGLAIGVALVGYLLLAAAAYLGGDLVFNIGYAVNHHAFQSPPTDWAPALPEAQLAEGKLMQVWVQGVNVLLYRRGSTISALSETCSHAGGPLAEGTVAGNSVVCPWHGSHFDLRTGAVKRSPATINAVRYDVRIQNGRIEVKRSAESLQPN